MKGEARKPAKKKAAPFDKFADAAGNVPIALYGKRRRAAEAFEEYRAIKVIISEPPTASDKLMIEIGLKPFSEALDNRDAKFFRDVADHIEKGPNRRSLKAAKWLALIAIENNNRRRIEPKPKPPMTRPEMLQFLAAKLNRPARELASPLTKLLRACKIFPELGTSGWRKGRHRRDDW